LIGVRFVFYCYYYFYSPIRPRLARALSMPFPFKADRTAARLSAWKKSRTQMQNWTRTRLSFRYYRGRGHDGWVALTSERNGKNVRVR
jgi:hypothetical protein